MPLFVNKTEEEVQLKHLCPPRITSHGEAHLLAPDHCAAPRSLFGESTRGPMHHQSVNNCAARSSVQYCTLCCIGVVYSTV